ncbi:MAG: GntR family transcriptional regulator [Alkaliphilus sp.]|nr:GntR family transcriptional regulator [bacterium AH-315-G05]PHS35927.1 MAG: GntR family transcriptional regulator [Alkaliphilus sp.]
MLLKFKDDKAVYIQLAESIEDDILREIFNEGEKIISTTEISVKLKINPATALKGINILVDEGIVYKKRGLGMFVVKGAKEKIMLKRKNGFFDSFIVPVLGEAEKLEISEDEIVKMIKGAKANGRN